MVGIPKSGTAAEAAASLSAWRLVRLFRLIFIVFLPVDRPLTKLGDTFLAGRSSGLPRFDSHASICPQMMALDLESREPNGHASPFVLVRSNREKCQDSSIIVIY
jgi:hypothetical protein